MTAQASYNHKRIFKTVGMSPVRIVVAVATILSVAMVIIIGIIAFKPQEYFAKSEDEIKKENVEKLGNSLQAHYSSPEQDVIEDQNWITALHALGGTDSIPKDTSQICTLPSPINTRAQNGYCYNPASPENFTVYTILSADDNRSKCTELFEVPYYVFDSTKNNACIQCGQIGLFVPEPGSTSSCK